jgi:hypothetical protein
MDKEQSSVVEIAKEVVKPAYEDVVQPAARASGKALGTVMNCFNMLLAPLERAQLASEAKTEAFRKSLENKFEKIPIEKRQEPDLKTVYQISDKLKYSIDNDEFRDMFENLLISSMTHGRTAHPLFVDVIDKMTSNDAQLFKFLCNRTLEDSYNKHRGLYLIELDYPPVNIRSYFLSWLDLDKNVYYYKDETYDKDDYEDFLYEFEGGDLLPSNDEARLHLETLEKLGIIYWTGNNIISKTLINYVLSDSVKVISDSKTPKYYRIIERPDVVKWIKSHYELIGMDRVMISIINRYHLTMLGKRLFEVLQCPDDMREFDWRNEY